MTTINPAFSFSQIQGDLGVAYRLAAEGLYEELVDKIDVWGLGVVPLMGDLAGSGTDTIRVGNYGGVGFAQAMTAMSTETDSVAIGTATSGYSEITLGMYGLGYEDTIKGAILNTPQARAALSLEGLIPKIPESWLKTFRTRFTTAGGTFSASVGSTATTLSIDDMIDFTEAFNEQDGVGPEDAPTVVLHPTPIKQARASAWLDPTFQNSVEAFKMVQGISGRVYDDFLGLGVRVIGTSDVTTSGGAYVGFGFQRGGLGYATASTQNVDLGGAPTIYVPQFGLIIAQMSNKLDQGTRKAVAYSLFGVAAGDSDVFFQRKILSTT